MKLTGSQIAGIILQGIGGLTKAAAVLAEARPKYKPSDFQELREAFRPKRKLGRRDCSACE